MDFFSAYKFREKADKPLCNCGDGCLQAVYYNASYDEYNRYISKLVESEFSVLQQHELCGNYFTALKESCQVNVLYTPCDSSVRVTVDEKATNLPFMPSIFSERGKTTFYCFENDHTLIDCGMCLMVQCPDNSFFVIDSGHYFQPNDNDRIHRFMRERTPAGERIVINGWLITHSHTDHISKLMDFLRYNCDDVVIEGFYCNLVDNDFNIKTWGREEKSFNEKLRNMLYSQQTVPVHKLHTGQRFYIRNLCFDVLCTHEDIYPDTVEDFNDTSVVTMLTAENTKIFIPGDASGKADKVLLERYGEGLKCDVVQIAHHGHFGLSTKAYELLDADLAVFPVTRIKFDEEYPRFEANRRAIELAKEYYISSDGTVEVPLPYKQGTVRQLPDETFEDFMKIQRLWGYEYTDEYKKELFELFCKNGGKLEGCSLPVEYTGSFLD